VPTQQERTEATTERLLEAARRLFAADGYAATSLDGVVTAAGVTKGALYHHFESKRELFRAVFDREHARIAQVVVAAAARASDPWDAFYEGCRAFFDEARRPESQRIALLDGPSALGWDEMRAIESRYSLELIRVGLERAVAEGRLADRPLQPLAHMLFGGLCEAATFVARSDDPAATTERVLGELRIHLNALDAGI
jgi:AcrR family transcriptional regulator